MVELTSGPCQNSKTVPCFRPGFSSVKRIACVPRFETIRPKILRKRFFFDTLRFLKRSPHVFCFCFSLFSFSPEKPQVNPKKRCFWDGMNLLRWAKNPEKLLPSFSFGIQKTKSFQNFRSSLLNGWPKSPCFRDKNPGRLHVTFFVFSQRSNVSSIIIAIFEKTWKFSCFYLHISFSLSRIVSLRLAAGACSAYECCCVDGSIKQSTVEIHSSQAPKATRNQRWLDIILANFHVTNPIFKKYYANQSKITVKNVPFFCTKNRTNCRQSF